MEGFLEAGGGQEDGVFGGFGVVQGVDHDEVVDDAAETGVGGGDAGLAQPGGVGLALVAQDVGLGGDDQGRRQSGEVLKRCYEDYQPWSRPVQARHVT